jgi:hypothetical protein
MKLRDHKTQKLSLRSTGDPTALSTSAASVLTSMMRWTIPMCWKNGIGFRPSELASHDDADNRLTDCFERWVDGRWFENYFCQATCVNAYFMFPKRNSAIPKLGRFPQYFAATHIFPLT